MKDYSAYLFDMDGTLVNSEPLKGKALSLACKDFGAEVDFNIYKRVMGESWAAVTTHFFEEGGISPDLDAFNLRFRKHYEGLLSQELALHSGAFNYLVYLKQSGKACALVSSAAPWMVEQILKSLQIESLFDVVITQADVSQHKPSPEAYLLALKRLDVSPEESVVIEDSAAGIEAGRSSGCDVFAIRHDFNAMNDFKNAKGVISSFEEL
ncbi:phosphorylated carbohydrates phosphatase [Vibrio nigripulchritudo]|uniref:HAD family hydrolase n=1 Tax=Vibrio nigripulchritudo TaxID=28173 RepID=UPI001C77286D|nr:HAD family phosphatase [Vibrio nigripulchritudo]BCL72013.1 phosphorylated carbohydrates phosphatase [Vibrio nigripulchritudo]BDU33371.1 phosphorylated carbohydrates phosphatase [Vibrio nigripulchritudo]